MSEMGKQRVNSIDAGRLVMALLVLTYHCRPWDGMQGIALPRILSLFTGTAVSYFFLVSGFFIFRDMEFPLRTEDKGRLIRALCLQLRQYLLWSLFYLPFSIYGEAAVYHRTPLKAAVDIIWGIVVLGRNYLSWHLWYLMALMVSELFVFFLARAGLRERGMTGLAAVFFVVGRVLDVLSGFHGYPGERLVEGYFTVFGSTYNALFSGFFFVSLGLYAAKHMRERRKSVLASGAAGLGIAAYLFYDLYLTANLLLAGCIFCIFLWILEIRSADSPIFPFIKEMSRMIYFIHLFFYGIFTIMITGGSVNPVKTFLYTFTATVIVSAAEAWYRTLRNWRRKK